MGVELGTTRRDDGVKEVLRISFWQDRQLLGDIPEASFQCSLLLVFSPTKDAKERFAPLRDGGFGP